MASQNSLDACYMQCAIEHSKLSKAIRAKVGAVLVTRHGVLVPGFNGTPSGASNVCENWSEDDDRFVTKTEVIHAELNCLLKCSKEGVSSEGATMYISLSPCLHCAAMMKNSGIKRVVYKDEFRCNKGLVSLYHYGIEVKHLKDNT